MKKTIKLIYKKITNINQRQEITLVLLMVLLGTFLFLLNSPLHPFAKGYSSTDSSVFKTVALMMEKGFMPYKDSFDHKGPLLFIINYFGNRISYYIGVWFIEYFFLAIAFFAIYKIARLFCNMWQSIAVFFFSTILLYGYFQGGNLTEEYAMMPIVVSLYIFIDYFENKKITYLRLFICGVTFAGTLMLRPNMIAVWFVMCLAVLFKAIVEKNYKELFVFIGWFMLGVALVIIPILVWLYCNGALKSCWNDYITFNFQYTSAAAGATFIEKCKSFVYFACTPAYLVALFLQFYLWINKKSIFNTAYLLLMIISVIFVCVAGENFDHYGMVLVPVVVFPVAKAFQEFNSYHCDANVKIILCIICFALFVGIEFSANGHVMTTLRKCENRINNKNIPTGIEDICLTLDKYGISEDEPISVYGNWNIVYVLSKRPHATTYSYQYPIGEILPSIMDDYMNQLEEELPKAIVIEAERRDDNIAEFLYENNYELVWIDSEAISIDGEIENADSYAQLYIRK